MSTTTPTSEAPEWLEDQNGNRCSVSYFGSAEAAQTALDSLRDCKNCHNCSGCSRCSRCSRCSGCSDCSRCSDCSGCSGCSNVAYLIGKKGITGDPDAAPYSGPPPIPTIENIHARVLAAASAPQALNMRSWHTCGTTHCRAGWVVHLAGEAGYVAERFYGPALAAQLIYRESNPDLPVSPVRFFETNDQALADMKAMAEREAA